MTPFVSEFVVVKGVVHCPMTGKEVDIGSPDAGWCVMTKEHRRALVGEALVVGGERRR